MNQSPTLTLNHVGRREAGLRRLALVPLIRRIVAKENRAAIREFHEHRTLFRTADSPSMSLATFLGRLHQTSWAWLLCGRDPVALDRAYDLTVSKFLERPRARAGHRRKGPDSRNYYRGFLEVFDKWRKDHPSAGALEEEAVAAVLLQRYVVRQFRKSCEEVQRNANPARSRYTWRLPGRTIVVYIPVSLAGRQRRKWLEDNIDDADPRRPGERERVQAIIDSRLGVPRHVPIHGNGDSHSASLTDAVPRSPFDVVITVEGLAKAVADEKKDNLDHQRPAIKVLGCAGLEQFILQAFQDLHDGHYQEKRLAKRFRLSRPTVSRFAGSRWRTHPESPPPDLWANVAQVLAANDDFVKAAKATRVWPRVRRVILQAAESNNGRHHHA
ncbi:MAG: hypothetical protein QUV05_20100 [Phycisphaerae bacterium]|nr:hypothetical protein [Phycisphaerae bacterium]